MKNWFKNLFKKKEKVEETKNELKEIEITNPFFRKEDILYGVNEKCNTISGPVQIIGFYKTVGYHFKEKMGFCKGEYEFIKVKFLDSGIELNFDIYTFDKKILKTFVFNLYRTYEDAKENLISKLENEIKERTQEIERNWKEKLETIQLLEDMESNPSENLESFIKYYAKKELKSINISEIKVGYEKDLKQLNELKDNLNKLK